MSAPFAFLYRSHAWNSGLEAFWAVVILWVVSPSCRFSTSTAMRSVGLKLSRIYSDTDGTGLWSFWLSFMDDPVWAMAEGCFQKVADAHSRQSVLWLPGFKADKVVLVHLNFGCVFDEENAFVGGDELPKDIKERRFSRSCATGDQNVLPPEN